MEIIKIIWRMMLGKGDPVKEIEYDAEKEMGQIPDGQPMSDFLNKRLRDK